MQVQTGKLGVLMSTRFNKEIKIWRLTNAESNLRRCEQP